MASRLLVAEVVTFGSSESGYKSVDRLVQSTRQQEYMFLQDMGFVRTCIICICQYSTTITLPLLTTQTKISAAIKQQRSCDHISRIFSFFVGRK